MYVERWQRHLLQRFRNLQSQFRPGMAALRTHWPYHQGRLGKLVTARKHAASSGKFKRGWRRKQQHKTGNGGSPRRATAPVKLSPKRVVLPPESFAEAAKAPITPKASLPNSCCCAVLKVGATLLTTLIVTQDLTFRKETHDHTQRTKDMFENHQFGAHCRPFLPLLMTCPELRDSLFCHSDGFASIYREKNQTDSRTHGNGR